MRLIDAGAVLKRIGEWEEYPDERFADGVARAFDVICDAPTIERCEDAISKKEAIDIFIEWEHKEFGYSDLNRGERFIDAINNAPSVVSSKPKGQKREWIPCSERLPETFEPVIVTNELGGMEILKLGTRNLWLDVDDYYYANLNWVLAWMPLPESYKKEADDEMR